MSPPADPAKPSPDLEWSNPRGSLKVELRRPRVLLFTATGHADPGLGELFAKTLEEHLRAAPRHVFIDIANITSYHPDVRSSITRVLLAQHHRVSSLHVFARSRLARMGVAVTSLAVRGLQSYGDRAKFLLALNAAIAEY
jgi:hypothetical protein